MFISIWPGFVGHGALQSPFSSVVYSLDICYIFAWGGWDLRKIFISSSTSHLNLTNALSPLCRQLLEFVALFFILKIPQRPPCLQEGISYHENTHSSHRPRNSTAYLLSGSNAILHPAREASGCERPRFCINRTEQGSQPGVEVLRWEYNSMHDQQRRPVLRLPENQFLRSFLAKGEQ